VEWSKPNGDFWVNQSNGVGHIPAAEITSKLQDSHHLLRYDLFDFQDGVMGVATTLRPLPSAVLGSDGRAWVSRTTGASWIDPEQIYKNLSPPPVYVTSIFADDKAYAPDSPSQLPVSPSNVRIDYTALSLSIPERVHFRYQLEGFDNVWQNAGTRRTPFYTKLATWAISLPRDCL
jgi:hypothetical protein